MGDILEAADFPGVRYLIGVSATEVPDAVFTSDPFLPFVELVVKGLADGWNSETDFDAIKLAAGDDWTFLRIGTQFLLAAQLVYYAAKKLYDSVKMGQYARSGRGLNWQTEAQKLVANASEAFSHISTRTFARPNILLATGPTSSGVAVPDEWEEIYEMIMPRIIDFFEEGESEDDSYYTTTS